MIICLDFDGTVVTHKWPDIGEDIGAIPVLKKLLHHGHQIILYTMRSGKELDEAREYLENRGMELWGINNNPDQIKWTTSPKVYAHLYIDDAALGVPLLDKGERPFVDWKAIDRLLRKRMFY